MNKFVEDVKMLEFPCCVEKINQGIDGGDHFVEITGSTDIPFEIKRIFYIYGSENKDLVRGRHANRRSEFVLLNISGSSKVRVIDENKDSKVYVLDRPNVGLYLPRMVWKEMYDFSKDSVLMVLSNEEYDATEYIRNFDEFVHELNETE